MITIYLDFDGTVVEHTYPAVGRENPFAMEVIKEIWWTGKRLIRSLKNWGFTDNRR